MKGETDMVTVERSYSRKDAFIERFRDTGEGENYSALALPLVVGAHPL